MIKNRKTVLLLNATGILVIFVLMAFEKINSGDQMAKELIVELNQPEGQYFIAKQDIYDKISEVYDSVSDYRLEEINISLLEDRLESIPYVGEAEVYSTLDGRLYAQVNQNKAIARIQLNNKELYLDDKGATMPLSRQHSAMVPRVTGNLDSTRLFETHQFLMHTSDDPFYHDFFSGLDFVNNKWILYPAQGRYHVTFGALSEIDIKLEKFKIFYQNTVTQESINQLKSVNLMFNQQVVYTNY